MCGESYSFECGSNYQSGCQAFESKYGGCNSSSSKSCDSHSYSYSACLTAINNYQSHQSQINQCYHQHHSGCGSGSQSVLTVAMQDAQAIGAGVQGTVGCSLDSYGQPTPPSLCGLSLPVGTTDGNVTFTVATNGSSTALANGAGDTISIASGDSNTLVVGDGAKDVLTVGSTTGTGGNNNTLVAGNGDGDILTVGATDGTGGGNNNLLVAGNGVGDVLTVNNGDSNIMVAGNGAGDVLSIVGTGDNNQLFAGNGATDTLFVNTGDNNALIVGNGDADTIFVGTGNNNDLHAGSGATDTLLVLTGDNNCLTVGDGDGANLSVGTGGSNDLEAGKGNADILSIGSGDNNLLHAGNGTADNLGVGDGDHNTMCVGSGADDRCEVGSGNYNLLTSGDGDGDFLILGTGNFDALIAGNGANDRITASVTDNGVFAIGNGANDLINIETLSNNNIILVGNGANDMILVGGNFNGTTASIGGGTLAGNSVVIGNGNGDQAWGSLGDGNNYMTGAGNDLVHTGGGADFVYEDNHTETATALDPFHLTSTDSLAQNLFADSGNDTFALQGTVQNSCYSYSTYTCGHTYQTAVTFQSECRQVGANDPGLGTTVMTGHDANGNLGTGGVAAGTTGAEKFWMSGLWGSAVITDFNSALGDRIMIGGVSDPNISNLGAVHFQYINSAYDPASTGNANLDLLITFGAAQNAPQQSIELLDYKPQDTGGTGGTMQFNDVTYNNPQAAETALSQIFDFSLADNQAVTNHIAALAAQNLILH